MLRGGCPLYPLSPVPKDGETRQNQYLVTVANVACWISSFFLPRTRLSPGTSPKRKEHPVSSPRERLKGQASGSKLTHSSSGQVSHPVHPRLEPCQDDLKGWSLVRMPWASWNTGL